VDDACSREPARRNRADRAWHWIFRWPKGLRHVEPDAILHPSVYKRAAAERVPHFYEAMDYLPDNLADHVKFQEAKRAAKPPPAAQVTPKAQD
jgi:hypothetical protein